MKAYYYETVYDDDRHSAEKVLDDLNSLGRDGFLVVGKRSNTTGTEWILAKEYERPEQ